MILSPLFRHSEPGQTPINNTATPPAPCPAATIRDDLHRAVAAFRAADLAARFTNRRPRLDWVATGAGLIGRAPVDATPEEGRAAVAAWAARLALAASGDTAVGVVDGVDVQLRRE